MKTLAVMCQVLEQRRQALEADLGHHPIGAAACEVVDYLIGRARAVAGQVSADAPITLCYIDNHMGEESDTLRMISATLTRMADLMSEGQDVIDERRQPFIRLIGRIESEGYAVDTNTFTTVTDPRDWSVLDSIDDPAVHVVLAADKITRAEQAALYQQRLERMDAAINRIEADYAQKIRDLMHGLRTQ